MRTNTMLTSVKVEWWVFECYILQSYDWNIFFIFLYITAWVENLNTTDLYKSALLQRAFTQVIFQIREQGFKKVNCHIHFASKKQS